MMRQWLDASLFGPMPAERLGWLRIIVGGFLVYWMIIHVDLFIETAGYPPGNFKPVGITRALPGALPAPVLLGLFTAAFPLSVAFTLGWRYRITGPLLAGMFLFLAAYRTSWGHLNHAWNLVALHAIVLALAPQAGEVLSLDARAGRKQMRDAWEWTWPIALLCTVTVITYWLAGMSKVMGPGGWGWALGDNLRNQVAYDTLNKHLLGNYDPSMAYFFFDHPQLLLPGSIIALGVEVFAPVALLNRWVAAVWAFLTWCMHVGIWFIMHIGFVYPLYGVAFAAFLPVERPLGWLAMMLERKWMARRLAASGTPPHSRSPTHTT